MTSLEMWDGENDTGNKRKSTCLPACLPTNVNVKAVCKEAKEMRKA